MLTLQIKLKYKVRLYKLEMLEKKNVIYCIYKNLTLCNMIIEIICEILINSKINKFSLTSEEFFYDSEDVSN